MKLNKWNSNDVHGRIMRVLLKQRTNMYVHSPWRFVF